MAGPGTFISVGRSLEQAVERVRRAEELGYDSVYVTHIAGRDSLTVLMAYAAATERIRLGTGVLPDVLAHACRDGPAGRHDRRVLRRADGARHRGLPPGHGRELVRLEDRASRWPRCASTSAPCGRCSRARRAARAALPDTVPLHGLRATRGPADLRRRPLPEHAAARGRDRRRRDAVALQPGVHPRRRGAGGRAPGASAPARAWRDSTSWPRSRRRSPTTARPPSRRCAATSSPTGACPFYRAMIERSGFGADIAAFDAGMKAGDVDKAKAGHLRRLPRDADRDRLAGRGARGRRSATATPAPRRPCIGAGAAHGLRRHAGSRRPAVPP